MSDAAQAATDAIIALCRRHPDESRVRYRINNGEWRLSSGGGFLELWDQPFAGTIDIDRAMLPDALMGGSEGGK